MSHFRDHADFPTRAPPRFRSSRGGWPARSTTTLGLGVHHVNTSNFFVRNTPWALKFLHEVYAQTDFLHHRLWENREVIYRLESRILSRKVQVVTQRRLNSYPSNYREGDFLIHFADIFNERRPRLMREYPSTSR